MQISSVSTNNSYGSFKGNIYLKGPWTQDLKIAFVTSPYVQALKKGKKDVVARIQKHVISKSEAKYSPNNVYGDKLYKISISMVHDNPISKLLDKFKIIKRRNLTHHYYDEESMINCFDELHFRRFIHNA